MIRVIDIETTGTDPETSAIVEIASLDLKRDRIENVQSTFVNPGVPIPPEASAIHHIIDDDVRDAPDLERALKPFKGSDWYVAHNAKFEQAFLKGKIEGDWICTYKCALRVPAWADFPSHSNQALRYRFGLYDVLGQPRATLAPHRALSDVYVTAAIFLRLLKMATWEELKCWSQEPALLTRLNFGKYYGESYIDIARKDEAYLEWIAGQTDMDKDRKFSAAHWLEEVRKERRA